MADLFLQSTRPTKLYLGSTEVLKVYCGSVLVWPILAVLSTSAISVYAATTATAGGNITSDGGSSITDRGICWSTSANPTISDSHTHDGTGTGSFTSNMTGLTASTLYHFRAYATNSGGTSYGSDISFTTAAMILPAISELTFPNGAGETTMDIQTYIAENGGGSILEMGVVYSTTNSTPTHSRQQIHNHAGYRSVNCLCYRANKKHLLLLESICKKQRRNGLLPIIRVWIRHNGIYVDSFLSIL